MADSKISNLPAATTPLDGTEVLPIVDGGVTQKVSVANLTAGRSVSGTSFVPTGTVVPTNGIFLSSANAVGIATNSTEHWVVNASGNLNPNGSKGIGTTLAPVAGVVATEVTVSTGNIIIGTAGKGIDFSADNPDLIGMTSELLDDYETGTWTPTLANGTSITYTSQLGYYTKIGNLVHVEAYVNVSNNDTIDVSNVAVAGLPYSAAGISGVSCPVFGVNIYDQTLLNIATHGNPALNFASSMIILNYKYSQCNVSGKLRLSAAYRV